MVELSLLNVADAALRQVQTARSPMSRGADSCLTNLKGNTVLHECIDRGSMNMRDTSNERSRPTIADSIIAFDESIAFFLVAARGDSLIDQHNAVDKTA